MGGHVVLNSHKFILIDADEYALKYMEKEDKVSILYTSTCTLIVLILYIFMSTIHFSTVAAI